MIATDPLVEAVYRDGHRCLSQRSHRAGRSEYTLLVDGQEIIVTSLEQYRREVMSMASRRRRMPNVPIPKDLYQAIDAAAGETGEATSSLIQRVLMRHLGASDEYWARRERATTPRKRPVARPAERTPS